MPAIASAPGALRLFAVSIVARLPVAMLSIRLLVHARHLTGSFAAAAHAAAPAGSFGPARLAAGAFAIGPGAGGPLRGALVGRRGQTAVLVGGALVSGSALGVGACTRTLIPAPLDQPEAIRGAYAAES